MFYEGFKPVVKYRNSKTSLVLFQKSNSRFCRKLVDFWVSRRSEASFKAAARFSVFSAVSQFHEGRRTKTAHLMQHLTPPTPLPL